jgi:hypothetical protein
MALICAWLGADAAGFHILYIPLAFPAFLWLVVGSWRRFVLLSVAFFMAAYGRPVSVAAEPGMVLFGLCVWGVSLGQLLRDAWAVPAGSWERDRAFNQGALALLGIFCGVLLGRAWPKAGPVAAPLPEGQTMPEGAGFIHAGDRVPGQVRALGAGLDRPASTLARPGTIRDLQLYMRRSQLLWRALAVQYPARSSFFEARASDAPSAELRDLSGREVQKWLQADVVAVRQLEAEGLDLGDLPLMLEKAVASGLADSDLEERIPVVPN